MANKGWQNLVDVIKKRKKWNTREGSIDPVPPKTTPVPSSPQPDVRVNVDVEVNDD